MPGGLAPARGIPMLRPPPPDPNRETSGGATAALGSNKDQPPVIRPSNGGMLRSGILHPPPPNPHSPTAMGLS